MVPRLRTASSARQSFAPEVPGVALAAHGSPGWGDASVSLGVTGPASVGAGPLRGARAWQKALARNTLSKGYEAI